MISSKNYLTARNVPFPPDKHAEINGKFVTLVSTFGEHWVAANKDHPLQQLWARDDGLAAVELVWLGDAIERMNAIDSRWTSREIKKIRGNDANNRSGALFEILGLSAFQGAAQTIRPMATGNPGYDGIITLTDTTEIQLSLKNYGTRSHEFDVRKHGRALEARAAEYLTANGLNGIGIRVMASAYPLTIGRWRAIEGGLGQAIIPALAQNAPVAIDDFWSLREFRLPNKFGPLARRYLSYTFMLTVPPHPNEAKSITGKLDEACANFRKQAKNASVDAPRAVLVRVPGSASIDLCCEWVRDYFMQSDEPLDGIILYQPLVVRDQKALGHYVVMVENPKRTWLDGNPLRRIHPNVFVGVPMRQPSSLIVTDGTAQFSLRGMYMYQRGNIYALHELRVGVSTSLRNLAPGIRLHAAFTMNGREELLQGKFPPDDELLLLS